MEIATRLHTQIEKVASITGVSIGNPNDRTTWKVHYADGASDQIRASVRDIIANFRIDESVPPPIHLAPPRTIQHDIIDCLIFMLKQMNITDDAALVKKTEFLNILRANVYKE